MCSVSGETPDATRTALGEAHPLTGLMYCADCGGKMYVHRTYNGKRVPPVHLRPSMGNTLLAPFALHSTVSRPKLF